MSQSQEEEEEEEEGEEEGPFTDRSSQDWFEEILFSTHKNFNDNISISHFFETRSKPKGYLPFTHIAHVRVDGKEVKDDWIFYLQPLRDHWVTVARGPPSDVIDAYGEFTKTMQKRFFSTQEWKAAIQARQTGFNIIGIRCGLESNRIE